MRTRNKKIKNIDAILTADWHIRATAPECRLDDFLSAMWRKVEAVFDLAKTHNCPILIAGDIGHRHQWPNWLIEKFIRLINRYGATIYAIPGQHDLPQHNLALKQKSAYGILVEGNHIIEDIKIIIHLGRKIDSFPFGIGLRHSEKKEPYIAMTHQMVIEGKPDWPGQQAYSAAGLLKKYPEYKLILSGDNHKAFTVKYKNRLLVNPGSLTRTTAIQADHKPRVYLWDSNANEVEAVYLPIDKDAIDKSHIDGYLAPQQQDKRVSAYVDRLDQSYELSLSFENNLEAHMQTNNTETSVVGRVWQAVEKTT